MNYLVITILAVLAMCGLAGFLRRRLFRLARTIAVLAVVLFVTVVVGTGICYDAPEADANYRPDYAVLLGLSLDNGQPRPELVSRMTRALQYLEENPDVPLIVSGGDPRGQGVTEARVMYDWLKDHGADMSRVFLEEQASDTNENMKFSRAVAEKLGFGTENVMILTSDYHQTRARYLAEKIGLHAQGLSSETVSGHLSAAVREVYAFIKAILLT